MTDPASDAELIREALEDGRDYIIGQGQSPEAEGWPRDQYAVCAKIEMALTAVRALADRLAAAKARAEKAEADCVHWAADYEERGKALQAEKTLREAAEARADKLTDELNFAQSGWIKEETARRAAEARLAEVERERDELKHDIARHVQIASDIATDAEARNAKLIEAATPFLVYHEPWMDKHADDVPMSHYAKVTFGQYRALRAALQSEDKTDD